MALLDGAPRRLDVQTGKSGIHLSQLARHTGVRIAPQECRPMGRKRPSDRQSLAVPAIGGFSAERCNRGCTRGYRPLRPGALLMAIAVEVSHDIDSFAPDWPSLAHP